MVRCREPYRRKQALRTNVAPAAFDPSGQWPPREIATGGGRRLLTIGTPAAQLGRERCLLVLEWQLQASDHRNRTFAHSSGGNARCATTTFIVAGQVRPAAHGACDLRQHGAVAALHRSAIWGVSHIRPRGYTRDPRSPVSGVGDQSGSSGTPNVRPRAPGSTRSIALDLW
jgi:hypothetical protein